MRELDWKVFLAIYAVIAAIALYHFRGTLKTRKGFFALLFVLVATFVALFLTLSFMPG